MAALERTIKGPRNMSSLHTTEATRKFPSLQTIFATTCTSWITPNTHLYHALWILGFRSNPCQNDNVHIKKSVKARWEKDLLDAFDPLFFLLCCWRWDAVECVVSFHNPSICFGLTCFDDLILVVWDEEFKAVLCKESNFRRGFYPEELEVHLSHGYFTGAKRGYKNNGASVWEILATHNLCANDDHPHFQNHQYRGSRGPTRRW